MQGQWAMGEGAASKARLVSQKSSPERNGPSTFFYWGGGGEGDAGQTFLVATSMSDEMGNTMAKTASGAVSASPAKKSPRLASVSAAAAETSALPSSRGGREQG